MLEQVAPRYVNLNAVQDDGVPATLAEIQRKVVVKIDVQGYECAALEGLRKFIAHPSHDLVAVMMEYTFDNSLQRESLEYDTFDA